MFEIEKVIIAGKWWVLWLKVKELSEENEVIGSRMLQVWKKAYCRFETDLPNAQLAREGAAGVNGEVEAHDAQVRHHLQEERCHESTNGQICCLFDGAEDSVGFLPQTK